MSEGITLLRRLIAYTECLGEPDCTPHDPCTHCEVVKWLEAMDR